MNILLIQHRYDSYLEAIRYLESNNTTVPERNAAIQIRNEFKRDAVNIIRFLLQEVEAKENV